MKARHRGYEITVTREPSMAGVTMLFYGVFRESDGYEAASGYSYSEESVPVFLQGLRDLIDEELSGPDPWREAEDRPEGDAP